MSDTQHPLTKLQTEQANAVSTVTKRLCNMVVGTVHILFISDSHLTQTQTGLVEWSGIRLSLLKRFQIHVLFSARSHLLQLQVFKCSSVQGAL